LKLSRSLRSAVITFAVVLVSVFMSPVAHAQGDPVAISAQKEAMKALAMLDGTWRGPCWVLEPSGQKIELTQTERVGPFLDGAIKVIEGKGYGADGTVVFNAFATVSYDAAKKAYNFRTYAMGHVGDFVFTPTTEGFSWEAPMGPVTIRYQATVKNGEWHQVGDRIVSGQEPVRFFEMNLKRIGDTDWPAGGAVPPK
jgi:hypothetical protein